MTRHRCWWYALSIEMIEEYTSCDHLKNVLFLTISGFQLNIWFSNNFHPVCIYQDLLIPFKNHPISFLLITFLHSKWSKVIYTQKACTIGIFYQLHICFLNDAWYTLYIYTCIYLNFRARTACIYITFYSVISFSTYWNSNHFTW